MSDFQFSIAHGEECLGLLDDNFNIHSYPARLNMTYAERETPDLPVNPHSLI